MRAIRTREHLYIRNYEPDRWPAGDPEHYGDIDNSPAKELVIESRSDPRFARFFEMTCARRPAEELYDLARDPGQANNIAASHSAVRAKLRARLDAYLKAAGDPRATGGEIAWDTQPYYGGRGPERGKK